MKKEIMNAVNHLCVLLSCCSDGDFVDEAVQRVRWNDPFDDELIEGEDND